MSQNGFRKFRYLPAELTLDKRSKQRQQWRKEKKQRRKLVDLETEQEVKENGHASHKR